MQLVIHQGGIVHCLYSEAIDLQTIGAMSITRGSYVEPDPLGQWTADLSPVDGPLLGPFANRSTALDAERQWLETHWLPKAR